jgi:antitoxin component YwqK of YwqJK toxin-antitoxin module
MKIFISFLILIFCCPFISLAQFVNSSDLSLLDDKYCLNRKPYSGIVLNFNQNEQLISKFQLEKGLLSGPFESYYEEEAFKKTEYLDTSVINRLKAENKEVLDEIYQLKLDSLKIGNELKDFVNYELGGQSKLEKLKIKDAKGKLNTKKKKLIGTYNEYDLAHSKIIFKSSSLASSLKKNEESIKRELAKPKFQPNKMYSYENYQGKKNGAFNKFYQTGQKEIEGTYNNNLMDGLWVYYFSNGNKKVIGYFSNSDGGNPGNTGIPKNGRQGEWSFYNENGYLTDAYNYLNGLLSGPYKEYYENGNLKVESNYLNGLLSGPYKEYYENGNIKRDNIYKNGVLISCTDYEENGEKTVWNIIEGVYTGSAITYQENGKVISEIYYVNGTPHGPFKTYFLNGKIQYKGKMDSTSVAEGNIIGDFYVYLENGSMETHVYVDKDGTIIDKSPPKKSNINPAKLNKVYQCRCCKSKIAGLKNGINQSGGEYINDLAKAYLESETLNDTAKLLGYQDFYEYMRREIYKYCTMKCARRCYE